jgi:hypothetical protein
VLYLTFVVLSAENMVFCSLLFVPYTLDLSVPTYHFMESTLIEPGRTLSSPAVSRRVPLPAQEIEACFWRVPSAQRLAAVDQPPTFRTRPLLYTRREGDFIPPLHTEDSFR